MDPKLQNFLEATGWSKEDLIRKLSAGENSKSAVVHDINCVTSTTPYKAKSNLQKMSQINYKTSNIIGNTDIVGINFYSDIPLPPSLRVDPLPPPPIPPIPPPESFLSDDMLRQLNTSSSYLPPLYSRDSPSPSDIGQTGVIDLVSDTESVDPVENIADGPRAKVIDISDSDESIKVIKHPCVGTQAKTNSTSNLLVEDSCNSKGDERRKEAFQWEKYVDSQLVDRDINCGSDRGSCGDTSRPHGKRKGTRKRRHRSSPNNHRREDRHHIKEAHHSRSRSRSSSHSRSHRRTDRSESGSMGPENPHRSRKRTRSGSKEQDGAIWYSKTSRSAGFYPHPERSMQSSQAMPNSYHFPRMAGPYIYTRRVKSRIEDALTVRLNHASKKKRRSLRDNFNECNNLSLPESNIPSSNTHITFRNIVAEENESTTLDTQPKQKPQKIELKRRDLKNLHADLQKLMYQSYGVGVNDQIVSDTAMTMSSPKSFIESKNKHLASQVPLLLSNENQANSESRAPLTNKPESTDKSVRVLQSTDTIVIDDDDDDFTQDVLNSVSHTETESARNIEIQNATPNKFTNKSPDRKCLNITDSMPLNILEEEHFRFKPLLDNDLVKQKSPNESSEHDTLSGRVLEAVEIFSTHISNNNASSSTELPVLISKDKCKCSPDEYVDTVAVELSTDANDKVNKLPKLQNLAIEPLSDISDYTSGDFTDETDIIVKESFESANNGSAYSQRLMTKNLVTSEQMKSSNNIPEAKHISNSRDEQIEQVESVAVELSKDANDKVNKERKLKHSAIEQLSDISDYTSSGDFTDETDIVAKESFENTINGTADSQPLIAENLVNSQQMKSSNKIGNQLKSKRNYLANEDLSDISDYELTEDVGDTIAIKPADLESDSKEHNNETKNSIPESSNRKPSDMSLADLSEEIVRSSESQLKTIENIVASRSDEGLDGNDDLTNEDPVRRASSQTSFEANPVELRGELEVPLTKFIEDLSKDEVVYTESHNYPSERLTVDKEDTVDVNMSINDNDATVTIKKSQLISEDQSKITVELEDASMKSVEDLSKLESEVLVGEDISNSAKYPSDDLTNNTAETESKRPVEDLSDEVEFIEDFSKDKHVEIVHTKAQILSDGSSAILVDREERNVPQNVDENVRKNDLDETDVTAEESKFVSEDISKLTVELEDKIEISSMKPIENLSNEDSVAEHVSKYTNYPSHQLTNNTETYLMKPVEDLCVEAFNKSESTSQTEPSIPVGISKSDEDVSKDEIANKSVTQPLTAEDILKYSTIHLRSDIESPLMENIDDLPEDNQDEFVRSAKSTSDEDVSKDEVANKSVTQPLTAEDISKYSSIHLRSDIESALMENIDDLPEGNQDEFVRSAKSTSEVSQALIEPNEGFSKNALDEIADSSKSQTFVDDNLKIAACSFEDITDTSDTEDTSSMKPTEIVFVDAQEDIIDSPESTRCITEDSLPDPLIDDENEDVEMKSLEDELHNTSQSKSLTTDVLEIFEEQNSDMDFMNIGTDSDLENSILNAVELIDDESISDLLNEVIEEDSSCDEVSESQDVRDDNDKKMATEELAETNQESGLKNGDSKSVDDSTDNLPKLNDSAMNATKIVEVDSMAEISKSTSDEAQIESVAEVSNSTSDEAQIESVAKVSNSTSNEAQIESVAEVSNSTSDETQIESVAEVSNSTSDEAQIESVAEDSNFTSDEAEQRKVVIDSLQKTVDMEKESIIESKLLEDKEDDTIPLDIETILRKCKENQDKALRDKAEQKSLGYVSPSAVRRPPKNRRPDFSSLRDNSMSTIQINLLLEQLSNRSSVEYKKLRPKLISSEELPDRKIAMAGSSKTSNVEREPFDFGKPFYDRNVKDDIRNEILKQLDILKVRRNDAAFSTSTNPTIIPKAKKTFAKLRHAYNEQDDDEEINIVNDNLESPVIWLTKTNDYTKIKGWKNKPIGVKTKKSSQPVWKTAEEDLAVPSCSFHYPSFVDNIIENVVSDNANEMEEECTVSAECSTSAAEVEIEVIESHVSKEDEAVETNPFSSSNLDNFMLDKSEMELRISFEVPELLMGPRIKEPQKIRDKFYKGDVKANVETPVKKDLLTKEGQKPRTLAEKRKLLKLEEARNIPLKPISYNIKQLVSKPIEVSRNTLRNPTRRTVNDDLPNVGHNKRKDYATASVYCKGKKYLVPCRERKAIYFRTKVFSRYETTSPSIAGSPTRIEPSKAVLWSPEKIIQKPVPIQNPKSNTLYKAGPMCKKPELIVDQSWKCVVKPLPKIFLEITAEYGKSLHPRALQFLYANPYVDLSKDKVDFALTALKDSKPTKYRLPVSYEKGQTQFTLRKKEVRIEIREPPKTPPACGDISSEVKDVVNDMLSCLEIQEIQEIFIKDDPDFDPHEKPKQIANSKCKKDIKESAVTTKVAAINKRLRIALGRLQVKFIDINIDEDPNKACDKAYCQYGCVCSSLLGALASKEHCRRIECVFGCICGYKPPINTTVTLPAGSDLDLFSTVDKLQTEATKNLAKVEKEFTQTIVCTKNETYVLGDTTDRKRRCTRVPKKYEEFLKAKEVPKDVLKDGEEPKPAKEDANIPHSDFIRKTYGVDITECSVQIEKVDMYHIIPFCWRHEEYQCQCLKEFLIARSEEKANILASQQDANVDDEANSTTLGDPGQKLTKYGLRKNLKKKKKSYYVKKSDLLKLKDAAADAPDSADGDGTNSDRTEAVATTSTNITTPRPDIQENQPTKSASRRKQVLNTMIDISEKQNIQLRLHLEPVVTPVKAIAPKLVPIMKRSTESKLMQKADKDALRFLLPTANVRQQFLKMLGKKEDAKDDFRLLSFLVLSNRFHRFLFHVWFSRAATTSKYILTMENIRPTPDAINVKYFPDDMRSDNYLIQWLMEGSIPVTEVQDFLVILRVIDNKSFDICGMCEKSKIEYTDEPSLPLPLTPPKAIAAPIPTPTPATTVPTMTYNINGSARQPRKILNIQNQKIPSINVVYPSVALTGQTGLIHASLPSINAKFRWLMMSFSSTFAVLNMTTSNYCVPHEYLVELVEQSRRANCTMMYKNREIRGQAAHPEFAIYVTPQHNRFIFIGPYHLHEELTCETLCYYKNMLVSTENFNKIHGNPVTPVGSWIKQLQMKVHSAAVMSVSSPTSVLKPILPKVTATSPPQLVRISDFMASKNGKQIASANIQTVASTNTSLLIVNNSIVSSSPSVATTSSAPKTTATVSSNIIKSPNNTAESTIPNTNIASDDICLPGLDYRDAEFKDKRNKTLQYLVTNIPGFGYIRIYRCHKTNIIYLMWRFVKMYKTLIETKKALISLIESTVIIAPSNFKVTISLLNEKPPNLKLIDNDYYFDTYIAGRFGVHLLSKLNLSKMTSCLRLDEVDVQYINERSSEMLLKKCYNIASTFLTKDDLAKIRNWKDMMAALKGTVDSELEIDTKLTKELKKQRQKSVALRKKLQSLTIDAADSSILSITPVKETSEVIEISDDEDDDDELMPKLQPEIILERQNVAATRSPSNQHGVDESPISDKTKTNTQQRSVGFVSMAQNFQGSFKLLPHNQNSVLITRIKNPPALAKTNTNNL